MTQKATISIQQAITDLQNLTQKKLTYVDIANVLGVSRQAIGSRIARDTGLQDFEWIKLKEHFAGFDKETYIDKLSKDYAIKKINEETIDVDYYPEVFGSCGSGTFVLAEYKERMSVPKKLFSSFSPVRKYSVINAFGDSMEPNIHDKDKLLVEFWEAGEQIKDNRVYVFRFKDRIFCKRLVDNITHVVVKSDNPIYEPIKIDYQDDFQIIGRIIGMIRDMG